MSDSRNPGMQVGLAKHSKCALLFLLDNVR